MKPQSAKAKGRKLQQWVRDTILDMFTDLHADDVRSTSMGASGEDVLLSPLARRRVPYSIECKSRENLKTLYGFYDQAGGKNFEPLLVIKSNHRQPLVIVDAAHFFRLVKELHDYKSA